MENRWEQTMVIPPKNRPGPPAAAVQRAGREGTALVIPYKQEKRFMCKTPLSEKEPCPHSGGAGTGHWLL